MAGRKHKNRSHKKNSRATKPLKNTARNSKPAPANIASSEVAPEVSAPIVPGASTSGVANASTPNKQAPKTKTSFPEGQAPSNASDENACKDPKLHVLNMDHENPNNANRPERHVHYDVEEDLKRLRAGYGLICNRKGSDELAAYCLKNSTKGKGRGKRLNSSPNGENKFTAEISTEDAIGAAYEENAGGSSMTVDAEEMVDNAADVPKSDPKPIKGKGVGKKSKPKAGTSHDQDTNITAQATNEQAPIAPQIFSNDSSLECDNNGNFEEAAESSVDDQQPYTATERDPVDPTVDDIDPSTNEFENFDLELGSNRSDAGSLIIPLHVEWSPLQDFSGANDINGSRYLHFNIFMRGTHGNAGRSTHLRYGARAASSSRGTPRSFNRGARARDYNPQGNFIPVNVINNLTTNFMNPASNAAQNNDN